MSARYVVTLVQDLTHNYRPDMVQLESPGFMGYGHEYHHEKDGVGLTAEDDFLLSLCFCEACVQRAALARIDARAAQRQCAAGSRRAWRARFRRRAGRISRSAASTCFAAIRRSRPILRWRFEPVTSLVTEIRAAADPAVAIEVIDDGWRAGSDLKALGRICDGVLFCAYDRAPAAVGADAAAVRQMLPPQCRLGAACACSIRR